MKHFEIGTFMRFVKEIIAGLSLILVGCGSSDFSETSGTPQIEDVLLVINGGNSTCRDAQFASPTPVGMGMWDNFLKLRTKIATARDVNINYVVSCYENSKSTVHFVTSEAPDTVISLEYEGYLVELDRLARERPIAKTFITGHSYGGWLALKTTLESNLSTTYLYSNDPISRKTCSFSSPSGCTSAPTDISKDHYAEIAEKTDSWENYYQTQTWYLHSSKISQADKNVKVGTSHTSIDDHEPFWTSFGDRIIAFL